jgi:hypothetical protein
VAQPLSSSANPDTSKHDTLGIVARVMVLGSVQELDREQVL